ncbi:MAG: dTDP-glucose 4,6-dehydratase [Chlamydiae bacterium]|nr:dTDP-glucose 4,6-dehydratase [Chlamydiota bacterium]
MKVVSATDLFMEDCNLVIENAVESLHPLKNSSVVIAGGSGFVGTWLTGLLTCLNINHNFNTDITVIGRSFDKFKASRPYLSTQKNFHFIENDVKHLIELPAETNWLIHAAANPDSRLHALNPVDVMLTIADGTKNILRHVSRLSDFRMLLNLSSGLVYGQQPLDVDRISETSEIHLRPCSSVKGAYPEAKRFAEQLCHSFSTQYNVPTQTARLFTFIGPYQLLDKPWAVNSFILDALSGNPIKILGNGQSVRSYLYGSDMAFWLLKMLVQGENGSVFNVGGNRPVCLTKVAELISQEFNPHSEIRWNFSPQNNPASCFVPDIALISDTLKLQASISLEHAIKKTLRWHKINMHI